MAADALFQVARENWDWEPLGDVCRRGGGDIQTGPFGSQLHASDYVASGVPSIMPQNISQDRVDAEGIARITPSDAERLSRYLVKPGDIVYSRRGDVERRALITEREHGWLCGTGCLRVRFGEGVVDPVYASYFLSHPASRAWVVRHAVGATMPNLNTSILGALPFLLPPRTEQRAIAGVLGALDEKIEQNRRTAGALELLARAIFQAWFVNFEPVKAKAAGATAFRSMPQSVFDALPTRLVNSELGAIPEGWERSTIGEDASHVAMGPFGSDIKTENFVTDGVPVIRGGNLTDGFIDEEFVYLTEAKADQISNANAFPGDLVITHRGTLGQVGLIPYRSRHRRYVVSQSQMLIRPNVERLPGHFLYLFLTSPRGQHQLLANRSQTGVPAISRPTTSIKAISIVVPAPSILLRHFESLASTLFDGRTVLVTESRKLAQIRDYLLPRLLSGQVSVDAARG